MSDESEAPEPPPQALKATAKPAADAMASNLVVFIDPPVPLLFD
ncbi:hypothetical protein [Actinomadura meyerae]|nr:hypothetical protein [Actinomadura meyerae]